MTVLLVVVVTTALWLALWAEDRAWTRNHPHHTEPPSNLDRLDGLDTPARSSAPSPPGKSERAGATTTDDPWMP